MPNAGNPVTKQTVDLFFGDAAVRFGTLMADAEKANVWLAGVEDAYLNGLGYGDDDVAALRDAAYAFGRLSQIYTGQATVDPATDFRVSIRKMAGLG